MITVLVLVVLAVAILGLAVIELIRHQREVADRVQRRAFLRWQQRQAERQVQQITQAAFESLLAEARREPAGRDKS